MADLNQQAQELAEIMERVNDEMRRYGKITEETAAALKAGGETRSKELKASGAAAADALIAVGKAAGAAASAMYDGKKGAAAFNDTIDSMATAATAAGTALMLLGGPIGLLAGAVTLAVTGVAKYAKAANEMSDQLYKGYSGLAKSGAAAADGMTGLYNDAKKLGLSMNELDGFVSLVGENSKDLALFGGTVFDGRKKFADMGKALEGSRESFFKLGISQEDQNKALMGYTRLQARLGADQGKITDGMTEAAKKYIVEQDALTKLTGASREEQEKIQEAALMEQQFRAKVRQMELDGDKEGAARLQALNTMYSSISPELGKSMRALATGNLTNADANKLFVSTQGQALDDINEVIAGTKQPIQALNSTTKMIGEVSDSVGTTAAMLGTANDFMFDYGEAQRLRVAQANGNFESMERIEKEQIAQGAKGAAAQDKLVEQQAKLLKVQQDANKATNDFVFQGIVPAQEAMIGLAEATRDAANKLNEMTGKKGEYGVKGTGTQAGSLAATGAGALTGAVIGSIVPVIGTAVGGAIGGAMGFIGYEMFGGDKVKGKAKTGAAEEAGAGEFGRAAGSLGATGKLIEDFGSGTPMTLHGREGVITEAQLNKFAQQAMAMQGNFSMPGLGDGPNKVKELARKQVEAQKSILELAEEEQDFTEKQNRIQQKMARDQLELSKLEYKQQKEFVKDRDGFYESILKNIKELADQTSAGGSAGGAGGGGVLGSALKGAMGGGLVGMIAGAISGAMAPSGGGAGSGRGAGAMGGGPTGVSGGPVSDNQGLSAPSGGDAGQPPKKQGGGGGGGAMSEQDIKNMIMKHEGVRYEPYKDSLGLWTVGVGHLIGDGKTLPDQWNRKFTHEEVMQLFDKDYEHHRSAAERIPGFDAMNGKGQGALTDLTFNMGPAWISKWPTLKKQLGDENVEAAADNLEKSKWYGQVGNRAPTITGMVREGISAANGGMFSGPTSGYPATLHGNEAVIPLKDGNVPAEIPKMDNLIEQNAGVRTEIESLRSDMTKLMTDLTKALTESKDSGMQEQMLEALQNIARTSGQSADTSSKILQASRN
jgi:GH24 family phage-related lysozyme (muramidase)